MSIKFDKPTWEKFNCLKTSLVKKQTSQKTVWVDNNNDKKFLIYLGEGGQMALTSVN